MRESLPEFIQAFWLTLYIGFFGILFSCVLGLICALIEIRKTPILSQLSSIYIELSRNTPLLIQLFFLYFALPKIGIRLSSEVCAVIGLAFLGGSYMAETLRAGFLSVEKIQKESALSLGMSKMQMMAYVVLPQALSLSVPSLTANVIFLFKETSVFSAVALADLMFVAKDLIGLYYKTTESLILLVLMYLALLLPISLLGLYLEKRLRYAGFGA